MGQKVSFEGALYFTQLTVYLAQTWPPSITATKWETVKYHLVWSLFFLSNLCMIVTLLFSVPKYYTNSVILTQTVTFIGTTFNLMIKMVIYRKYFERSQILIQEMEVFLKNAEPHEIIVCRRYVDRCAGFHCFISLLNYFSTALVVFMPLLIHHQALPTAAVYPFPVDEGIVMFVVYLHQILAGFQCSSGVTIDCQTALLLWFSGARLEILADELTDVNDIKGLEIFVRKHRKLLAYAVDVSDIMAYIALASSMACGIAAIMSGLQLCGNQPLFVKMQFGPMALLSSMNLFICAWPADNLINVCDRLEKAAYNTTWVDMSLDMMKNILILLQRCQRPVIVSVGGFLPTLSLASYASFLSVIFSYFTTLRVVMMSDEKNN